MTTPERLALKLEEAGAPAWMIQAARDGRYDDFKSDSATPIVDLVHDLKSFGLHDLAQRAINGEFDATKEESGEWFRNEGKNLLGGKP